MEIARAILTRIAQPLIVMRFVRRMLVLLAIGLILASYFWSGMSQVSTVATEPEIGKDVGPVRVAAELSSNRVLPRGAVHLGIAVTNESVVGLNGVEASLVDTPGFQSTAPTIVLGDVGPHKIARRSVRLNATEVAGRFRLAVRVSWSEAGVPKSVVLLPGPVTVQDDFDRFSWIATTVQAISKDLALPLVLLLLSVLLKRAEDIERDRKARADFELERISETAKLMLPTHHRNVERYYLPLLTILAELNRYRLQYEKTKDLADLRRAFFFVVMWVRHVRRIRDKIGGLYFRSRDGELLLAKLTEYAVFAIDACFGRSERDTAIDALSDPGMSVAAFEKTLAAKGPFPAMWTKFQAWNIAEPRMPMRRVRPRRRLPPSHRWKWWLFGSGPAPQRPPLPPPELPGERSLKETAELLQLFRHIMRYECNRPYKYWYGKDIDFPKEDVLPILRQPIMDDPALWKFRTQLARYLRSVNRERVNAKVTLGT